MNTQIVREDYRIVRPSGDIDLSNADEFEQALNTALAESAGRFIIDLSDCTYMDSAGVQAILRTYVKVDENGGCLALVVGNERIRSVLEVLGLEQLPLMRVVTNLDEAKRALSA